MKKMAYVFPLFTLLASPAFAASPGLPATKAEIAKVSGTYQLTAKTKGTCPDTLLVRSESFANSPSVGIGFYGSQPGDVVIQLSSLNAGKITDVEENPMIGGINGYEIAESSIGAGKIVGYSESDNAQYKRVFRYDFSASYDGEKLSYDVKYDGSGFNQICFENACEYARKAN